LSIGERAARVQFDCGARSGLHLPSTSVGAITLSVHGGWKKKLAW
jgi:hypothetical protein